MSYQAFRLTALHQRVEEAIRAELKRSVPSSVRLLRLKRLKIKVKDRLTRGLPVAAQAA